MISRRNTAVLGGLCALACFVSAWQWCQLSPAQAALLAELSQLQHARADLVASRAPLLASLIPPATQLATAAHPALARAVAQEIAEGDAAVQTSEVRWAADQAAFAHLSQTRTRAGRICLALGVLLAVASFGLVRNQGTGLPDRS